MNQLVQLNREYERGAIPLWRYIQRATYLVLEVAPKRNRIRWANTVKYCTIPVPAL